MEEQTVLLEGHHNYLISNYGAVINTATGRELSVSINNMGIPTVGLNEDGVIQRRSLPRLIAEHFVEVLPDYAGLDTKAPIHLDGNRMNCRADNLAWRPRWFAILYHQQDFASANDLSESQILNVDTNILFDNAMLAAMTYGSLEREIFLSAANMGRISVMPYHHHYEFRF